MFPKHGRKPNRLKEYDYSEDGFYFVTICTKDKKEYFGKVNDGKMILNKYGEIIKKQWLWLPDQYQFVTLDEFIIMPNHLHGIIIIDRENVGTGLDLSLPMNKKLSLSNIVGAFKTTSSKLIHLSGLYDFRWQRSFYDHIIWEEKELINICQYIANNPEKWEMDKENPENLWM